LVEFCLNTFVKLVTLLAHYRPDPTGDANAIGIVSGQVAKHRVSAAFTVNRSEDYAANSMQQQRPEAHQTRLERGIANHLPASRPRVAWTPPERLNLGVATGIIVRRDDRAGALGDDRTCEHDERSDRGIPTSL